MVRNFSKRMALALRGGRLALALALTVGMFAAIPTGTAFAATFTVTKTADTNDGVCDADCSLREAIVAANAAAGADTITLSGGTYTLTRAGSDDNAANGDLDVTGPLTINGNGAIIQAGTSSGTGIDKIFSFNPLGTAAGFAVNMSNLTLRFGKNAETYSNGNGFGGCFDFDAGTSAAAPGSLSLSSVTVTDCSTNDADGGGAALFLNKGGAVSISNSTFQNNKAGTNGNAASGLGGAIFFGTTDPGSTLNVTISNTTIANNQALGGAKQGGGLFMFGGGTQNYQLHGVSITGNSAASDGGGIYSTAPLTIDNAGGPSTISNNTSGRFGGGVRLSHSSGTSTISKVTFTGNTAAAGGAGGAIRFELGTLNMSFSRIVNNTSPAGTGSGLSVNGGTANATNNWWGCSTGPSAAPCDIAKVDGTGTANFTPWLRVLLTAGSTTLVTNQSTALTANANTNSAGTDVSANIDVLKGLAVTWSAVGGTISSAQTTIQSNGTATATYTANAAAAGNRAATKVDNDGTTSGSNVVSFTVSKANTTTTITGDSPDPSGVNQAYTVTYTVAGSNGNSPTAPTGNVTVSDGTSSCTGTVAAGSCSLTSTSSGAKTLTATYAGDGNFNGSTSAGVAHTVSKASTTTTITSDTPDPSIVGTPVTVNFTVTASSGTPTGNVTVSDGVDSCSATVAAGSCSITLTTVGARTLTATYAGDTNFNGSSGTAAHTVNPLPKTNTTTTITSDTPDPSTVGEAVTINFTVAASSGTPTGNVTVSDGVDSCSATVAAGSCSITLTTVGARTLTATYAGDTNFNGSTSANEPHTVNPPAKADTTTITSDSPDPSVVGQSVTINFTVTASSGTPTGNVTVTDGTQSCSGTVAAGSCTITFSSPGAKTLTATYTGDANFNGSTSAGAAHTVNKADTTTTITSDTPDPSSVGQPVTVKFTVAAKAPGAGTPTGNVVVTDGVDSCTASVAAGQCDITFSTSGSRTITASYGGDSNFLGSSDTNPHIVNLPLVLNLAVLKTHTGNFSQGQSGAQYTIKVSNPGTAGTNDTVTVVDSLPAGLTATAISGSGWTCALSTLTCTRSDALAAGSSYPDITLTVNVANNAPASVTNSATVSISGDSNASDNTSNDPTTIDTDNTPPDTTITSMPSNPSNSSSASFSFSGSDSGTGVASFECSLDGSSFTACTSAQSYSGLADGQHTFKVRAIDGAGNADQTPDSYTWVVDTTAPSVTINQAGGQADPTSASPIHFTVVFDEPVSGFTGADVTLSGTAGATTAVVTEIAPNNGTTYNVAVSGMTTSGTVIATIPAGVAQDAAGNGNNANTSTDNSVMYIMPVVLTPDLTITKTHSGNFTQGQSGAQYTITVANVGNGASSGTVTAVDTLPAGLTATAISGSGWSCDVSTLTCTRSDALAAGSSYPDITLTVNVASNAPASVTNSAAVSGGGETNTGNDTASDPTTITTAAKINTTTTITADTPDPSTAGQAVTVSYTVVPASGSGTPTGNVSVTDGVNSCTGTVAAGQCSITLTTAGARTLTATYAGDSSYNGSTSAGAPHTVNPASTTPTCNGLAATIYVLNGKIVGGPDNGKTYKGSLKGTTGNDVIVGTEGKDSIDAKNGDDTVCGLGGDDKLTGDNGTDYLDGGTGKDELKGSSGNDTLVGGEGNDKLDGDEGNDTLIGGEGDDKLDGDKGNDTLTGNAGKDTFKGGDGTDTATDYNPAEGDKLDGKLP